MLPQMWHGLLNTTQRNDGCPVTKVNQNKSIRGARQLEHQSICMEGACIYDHSKKLKASSDIYYVLRTSHHLLSDSPGYPAII